MVEPAPVVPRRVVVVGNSGSGKTTLARRLAELLDADHVELDSIFHQPGWTELPDDVFRERVAQRLVADRWVVDGNYRRVSVEIVHPMADTVVWFDLPKRVVMTRVIRRTVGRGLLRRELWNGNRERLGNIVRQDPEENIVLWSWTQHDAYRAKYQTLVDDGTWAHCAVHRLRRRSDVERLVSTFDTRLRAIR